MDDQMKIQGHLLIYKEENGAKELVARQNTILTTGKYAVAHSLGYDIGGSFQYYVDSMIFGDGGEESGVPKTVPSNRTELFGTTRASLTATSSFSPDVTNQVTFTSVLTPSHANGYTINEAALKMANGSLFSMVTFNGVGKTSAMTLTYNWTLTII